jgi:hypothetical protein
MEVSYQHEMRSANALLFNCSAVSLVLAAPEAFSPAAASFSFVAAAVSPQ